MAEGNARDRWETNQARRKLALRGQWLSFLLMLLVIGGGLYLVTQDKNVTGFTMLISGLGTMIGTYLYGIRQQNQQKQG